MYMNGSLDSYPIGYTNGLVDGLVIGFMNGYPSGYRTIFPIALFLYPFSVLDTLTPLLL